MKFITFVLLCILTTLGIALVALAHYTQDYTILRFEVYDQGDDFFGHLGVQYQQSAYNHEKKGIDVIRHIQANARDQRNRHLNDIRREEQVEECIEKITKNWKRELGNELIIGYNEEEDFKLRWRLRNRALDGEKICRHKIHS